jgi:ribonuclease HI
MKYYAIRQINGETVNEILTNWTECEAKVKGNRVEYKSFKTEKEAKEYLGNHIEEEKETDALENNENHIYYVDGSYMNDTIGWGFVYVKHNQEVTKMCGSIKPNENTSRNITGELEATKMAVRHAIINELKEVYIVHDYQGISSYVTGAWNPKTQESKDYTEWMNKAKDRINIKFIKVAGHSNNRFNDVVDNVAKMGTTL